MTETDIAEIQEDTTSNRSEDDVLVEEYKIRSNLLYSIEDTPPISTSLFLGLQHYLLAVGGIIGVPLILASFTCMFETEEGLVGRALVINSLLFVSGLSTFLQTTFGVRLPIMQGASYAFVTPSIALLTLPENLCPSPMNPGTNGTLLYNDTDGMIVDGSELWKRRILKIQGSIAVASIVELVLGLTGCIGVFMRLVNPITIATAITLIGVDLFPVAHMKSSPQWGIAILTSTIIILCSQYFSEFTVRVPTGLFRRNKDDKRKKYTKLYIFKLFPVILAVSVSWILSAILTASGVYTDDKNDKQYWARTDARVSVLHNSHWFRIPYPFQWGVPDVVLAGVIGMLAAVIGGMIESVGDYYACARIAEAPPPPAHAINRGIAMEAFACILNGLIGTSAGTTSFSENCGAIGITRVGSRRVLQVAGILMIFLGMFGKFGGILVMIPDPIIGGLFMVVFSMIISVGLSNLNHVNLNAPRNIFILGFSLFMGIMLPQYLKANPHVINTGVPALDQSLTVLLEVPMLVGSVISIFFDATLRDQDKQHLDHNQNITNEKLKKRIAACYDLPFSTNFRFARYIPILPQFGKKDQ